MTIDKNVPLWPKTWSRHENSKRTRIANALLTMEVNDSTVDLIQTRSDQTTVLMAARKHGIKVATRRTVTGDWRVWRIK